MSLKNNSDRFFSCFTVTTRSKMDAAVSLEKITAFNKLVSELTVDFKAKGFTQDDIVNFLLSNLRTYVDYRYNNKV